MDERVKVALVLLQGLVFRFVASRRTVKALDSANCSTPKSRLEGAVASATLQVILAIFGKNSYLWAMQMAARPGFPGGSVVEQKCDVMAHFV